jgi:hypothetical protein
MLKTYTLVNVKGYIHQYKGKYSFKEISILDFMKVIHYYVWSC